MVMAAISSASVFLPQCSSLKGFLIFPVKNPPDSECDEQQQKGSEHHAYAYERQGEPVRVYFRHMGGFPGNALNCRG